MKRSDFPLVRGVWGRVWKWCSPTRGQPSATRRERYPAARTATRKSRRNRRSSGSGNRETKLHTPNLDRAHGSL